MRNNEMEQRSEEWFKDRKGKLTGSNIGAALGVNPWKTPDDLIRQMVREYHGAESEFTGNIATEYGRLHEPLASMDYMAKTGNMVQECGFYVHPEHDWLGASPDGLIDEDGLIEIKCPFGQRNAKPPVFKTCADQPHYFAQVQTEMACTGRKWTDFYQWTQNGDDVERVEFDPQWWADSLPVLLEFYHRYINELENPVHLEDKHKEINTITAQKLLDEYDELSATIDDSTARKKEVLSEIVKISKERNSLVCGRKLTLVERKGSIAYQKVVKEHLKDLDLKPYTGKPSEYWKLS
jgi:putative phage-type endonuclease